MRARNSRNGKVLSENVAVADSLLARMRGLIGRPEPGAGESLWIKPCRGIHTIGMKFPIDVLFLDAKNTVVRIRENIPPNRCSAMAFRARTVLELPAGIVSVTNTRVGDTICFRKSREEDDRNC